MDAPSIAETLPETYRRVLDRVADLETAGHRREADLVRRDAIAAYSRRWNARASRGLERLADRAERVLDGRAHARDGRTNPRTAAGRWLSLAPLRIRRRVAALARGSRPVPPRPRDMTPQRPAA